MALAQVLRDVALGRASTAQHVIRDGDTASALRPIQNGNRTPLAVLGNRTVADTSTANRPTSNHLPANPSDELPPNVPSSFAEALGQVKTKVAGLKAKGLPHDVVHAAMMQDVVQLAHRHGVIKGRG